jgi:hypothetical protein
VTVEFEDEAAAVVVAELLGDDPGLELELVAGAEVAQLVDVELVVGVDGDALPQVMCGRQRGRERAPDRVPGSPEAFLAELVAALAAEDRVATEAAGFVVDGARVRARR